MTSVSMRLAGKSWSSLMLVVTPKLSLRTASATDDFFKRSIPGAFADSIDGAFDLANSGANGCERIRHRQPRSSWQCALRVMPCCVAEVFANATEHVAILFRDGVADGVRQIQNCCAGFHRRSANLAKIIDFGSAGVFGGKFHFADMLAAVTNHRRRWLRAPARGSCSA